MLMRERWTEDEERRAAELYLSGKSKSQVGRELGRSKESVAWKLCEMGVRLAPDEAKNRQYKGSIKGRLARYSRDEQLDRAWEFMMTHCDKVLASISEKERACLRFVRSVDRPKIDAFNAVLRDDAGVIEKMIDRGLIKMASSVYVPTRLGFMVASTL